MRPLRLHTPLDQFLIETQRALETVFGSPAAQRPNPAGTPRRSNWTPASAATRPD